jgi:3(or 17)beta-hydroxysteroid dehydrogenase
MGRLDGKVAIITGAAHGIGEAIAARFAQEGAKVVSTDIETEIGQNRVNKINDAGGDALFIKHDASSQEDWISVFEKTIEVYGKVNILVNNAGIGEKSDIETMELKEWKKILAINLDSVFLGTQLGIRHIKKMGGGSIINMSSIAGFKGTDDLPAYTASKAGIRYFSKCAALHCGKKNYNIRVNSIHPGSVRTRAGVLYLEQITGLKGEAIDREMAGIVPMGRICETSDIASGALYLASDESLMVNGTELVIDGGLIA